MSYLNTQTFSLFPDKATTKKEFAQKITNSIISQINTTMKQQKISQTKLAQNMGVHRSHISLILNKKVNLTLKTIVRLGVALNMKWNFALKEKGTVETYSEQMKHYDKQKVTYHFNKQTIWEEILYSIS